MSKKIEIGLFDLVGQIKDSCSVLKSIIVILNKNSDINPDGELYYYSKSDYLDKVIKTKEKLMKYNIIREDDNNEIDEYIKNAREFEKKNKLTVSYSTKDGYDCVKVSVDVDTSRLGESDIIITEDMHHVENFNDLAKWIQYNAKDYDISRILSHANEHVHLIAKDMSDVCSDIRDELPITDEYREILIKRAHKIFDEVYHHEYSLNSDDERLTIKWTLRAPHEK